MMIGLLMWTGSMTIRHGRTSSSAGEAVSGWRCSVPSNPEAESPGLALAPSVERYSVAGKKVYKRPVIWQSVCPDRCLALRLRLPIESSPV